MPIKILRTQKLFIKRKQRFINFKNIAIGLFDKIFCNNIKLAAFGKGKTRP